MDGSEVIDDDDQITHSSILEDPLMQYKASSCSNDASSNSVISREPDIIRKKKKGSGYLPGIVLSLSSRRKGAPHRAPLSQTIIKLIKQNEYGSDKSIYLYIFLLGITNLVMTNSSINAYVMRCGMVAVCIECYFGLFFSFFSWGGEFA